MSQKKQVLEYLQKGYSLTPMEALKKFGSFRLGAVIFDLIQEGYNIVNVQSHTVYPEGTPEAGMRKLKTRYAEYVLQKKQPEVLVMTPEEYQSASMAGTIQGRKVEIKDA